MKKTIIRTFKILAVLIPILVFMALDPGNTSYDRNMIRDFYRERPNTLDVVVLGASEVFSDYSAVHAYEEFGFTSYPYAMPANQVELYRSQLEEIFSYQNPELVVIEITPAMTEELQENMGSIFYNYIGRVPLSVNKLRTIWEFGDRDQWLSYVVPFVTYHNTSDLKASLGIVLDELFLYRQGYSLLKGTMTYTFHNHENPAMELPSEKQPLSNYTQNTLQELLEFCQEKQYDNLLFVTFPHRVSTEFDYYRSMQMHSAGELIESFGYPYLNLEPMGGDIALDSERDYYDDDHMNLYGQKKFTSYLAKILTEKYGIEATELSDKDRQRWEQSVVYYGRYFDFFDEMYVNQPEESRQLWESKWLIKQLQEGDAK